MPTSMKRDKADQWSLGRSPASIISSFTLSLKEGHSDDIDKGRIYSTNCGLGWRFAVVAKNADTELLEDKTSGNVLIVLQKTRYELIFDAHLIKRTDLESLTITTTAQHLTNWDPDSNYTSTKHISLRLWGNTFSLGVFNSVENFTGDATLTFEVAFPATFGLSLPAEPPSLRIRQALDESLMGRDLIDTKFVLFTRRTREHQPGAPRAVFANSRLLHGFSTYLDTCECGVIRYNFMLI
jgi:hypothetical protein